MKTLAEALCQRAHPGRWRLRDDTPCEMCRQYAAVAQEWFEQQEASDDLVR